MGKVTINTKVPGLEPTAAPTFKPELVEDCQYKFQARTLVLTKNLKVCFNDFNVGSTVDPPWDASKGVRAGVFWDLRNVKAGLRIDDGKERLHHDWVSRASGTLQTQLEDAQYPSIDSHFFMSEKSWVAKAQDKMKDGKKSIFDYSVHW